MFEQVVAAFSARIEGRAGYCEDLTALLERKPSGDQRARTLCRLHHHDAGCEPGNEPVSARKIAGTRLPSERHLGEEEPLCENGIGQGRVLGRIDLVMSSRQDSDGSGTETPPVCGGIDAARQT